MLRFTSFVLLVSLAAGFELKAQLNDQWKFFKNSHKKSYPSEANENVRKEIFKRNVELILKQNLDYDLKLSTHQLGINEFADMTHEEFAEGRFGFRPDLDNQTASLSYAPIEVTANIPASVDYRQRNVITDVKDQGLSCGSCWAFATTGALETHYALKKGVLNVLSEQNLIDCSNGDDPCRGGAPYFAFLYILHNDGINKDSCYPYKAEKGTCNFTPTCVGATLSEVKRIPKGSEDAILNVVATKGPVVVAIDAGQPDFMFYKKGVYNNPRCNKQILNHAVLIIGYGTEEGQDYWLVKNSWGPGLGDKGYWKMARNVNMCGIANTPLYPVI